MKGFHVRKGIYFRRAENGSVILLDSINEKSYRFTKEDWCSIITAVAAKANDAVVHQKVCEIHLEK